MDQYTAFYDCVFVLVCMLILSKSTKVINDNINWNSTTIKKNQIALANKILKESVLIIYDSNRDYIFMCIWVFTKQLIIMHTIY